VTRTGVGNIEQLRCGIVEAGDRFVTAFRAVESAAPQKK